MGLLKKRDKKKLKSSMAKLSSRRGAGGDISPLRPQTAEKKPPCTVHCPSGNDIRGWLTVVAQREKLGLSLEDAMTQGWKTEVETNPFPSIMGRVCPHPCESNCNRKEKDGPVAINSVERELGDCVAEQVAGHGAGNELVDQTTGGNREHRGKEEDARAAARRQVLRGHERTARSALASPVTR